MEETTTISELQVPGEPGVYWCARHKKVKTRLRCGRCETPICPQCTVMGPTGARCRNCASNRSAHIYQISPVQFAITAIVSVVLGTIGAVIVSRLPLIGIFVLLYAPAAGTLIGKVVSAATRGKRGTSLAVVASAGVVIGAVIPLLADPFNIFLWLYLILAVPGVWWWLK
jgi:hypothetical protein